MIQDHEEQLPMMGTKLGHYPIVLENHWLRLHDVQYDSHPVRLISDDTIAQHIAMMHPLRYRE